jgi:hypothetical protein
VSLPRQTSNIKHRRVCGLNSSFILSPRSREIAQASSRQKVSATVSPYRRL